MGFLSFLKKKEKPAEEPAAPREEDVRIEELAGWFSQAFKEKLDSAKSDVKGMFRSIASNLESMEKASKGLEKAEFETGDKTYAAVNMIKNDYVKKLKRAFLCASREPESDYASLISFHSKVSVAINELLAIGPRQAILLSRYFSSEMKTVVKKIKETKETLDKMESFLKGEGAIIKVNDELAAMLAERKDAIKKLDEIKMQLKESEGRLSELSGETSAADAKLKEFEVGGEWKRYASLKESIRLAEEEASGVEESVRSALSVTKRPLKKFRHVTDQKVDSLISDPFIEFSANPTFFSSVLGKMLETNIGLKEKEKEKLEDLSRKIPSLEEEAKKHRKLAEKASDAKRQLEACMALKEREKLEAKHSDAKVREERLKADIKKERERISQFSEALEDFKKKGERLINNCTDRRVRLAQQQMISDKTTKRSL